MYFSLLLLIFLCRIYAVSSEECTQIFSVSGTISNEKRASWYSKCWSISVPQNSKAHITLESFSTDDHDCMVSKVKISLNNKDETHNLCDSWNTIILDGDFTVTHEISNAYDIRSSFSLKYHIENLLCSESDTFQCSDGTCTLQSQICDGVEKCSNGADENDCENKTVSVLHLNESLVSGVQWMKNNWSDETGWQENTHRGITALFLATERNPMNVNIKEKLMVKQLNIQTLAYLLRKETDPLTANQLSMFVNALIVSCQDPYNFYGHDLVKLLGEKDELSFHFTHPITYLALCNAGAILPENATNYLSNLLNSSLNYPFLLDVRAMAVMTLSCLQANQASPNASFPQSDYEDAVTKLKELQLADGSFGNVYTTAIVTQALVSAGQESSEDWKYNKAIKHLIPHLNSSSVDFLAVYMILPLLNGKCLSHIRNTNCGNALQRKLEGYSVSVKSKLGPKMRVHYSLYIGDEKDIVHAISLRVPENSTVHEVMQLAQDADSKYRFHGKQMGETLYVYNIAHIVNDLEDGTFWLLYVGKDAESMTHTNESPDKVILQDGAHIVMWYRKAQI